MVSTMTDERTATGMVEVTPESLERWMAEGEAVLVDVREPFEHAEEHIDGAELVPLGTIDPAMLRARHASARVVFQCKTGKRAAEAVEKFRREGEPVYVLRGGIDGWKAARRPVVVPAAPRGFPVMRQVQIVAGALVAAGTALGVILSPWFLVVPGFVGCGLVFAGTTGWCGMAKLLGVMPWNRRPAGDPAGGSPSGASCCGA